jgi:hypothetical protein
MDGGILEGMEQKPNLSRGIFILLGVVQSIILTLLYFLFFR